MTTTDDEEDWSTCDGTVLIRRAKHILAYGGGPEGGFVMINSEWCSWNREWAELATYRELKDQKLIWRHLEDEDETINIVPKEYQLQEDENEWDADEWSNETIILT